MLANGTTVDWRLVESEVAGAAISGVGERDAAGSSRWRHVAAIGWNAIVVVGLLQVALVTLQAQVALSRPAAPMPGWLFLANVLLFGTSGALLLLGGRHDPRPQALGAVFVLIATAFAHPLAARIGTSGWVDGGFARLSLDAFSAAALWRFVWVFPRVPEHHAVHRVGRIFVWSSCIMGVLLACVSAFDGVGTSAAPSLLRAFDRDTPNSAYWLLTYGIAILALPYLA